MMAFNLTVFCFCVSFLFLVLIIVGFFANIHHRVLFAQSRVICAAFFMEDLKEQQFITF